MNWFTATYLDADGNLVRTMENSAKNLNGACAKARNSVIFKRNHGLEVREATCTVVMDDTGESRTFTV